MEEDLPDLLGPFEDMVLGYQLLPPLYHPTFIFFGYLNEHNLHFKF